MNLTRDDLLAIGKVVEEKIQANNTVIREEIKTANTKLLEDIAELFHETWKMMDKTNERVTEVEEQIGIAPKN